MRVVSPNHWLHAGHWPHLCMSFTGNPSSTANCSPRYFPRLRPFSWDLGKHCTPRQRPIPVWQPPCRTGVHLPKPATSIIPYPQRRPLPPSPTVPHSRYGSCRTTVAPPPCATPYSEPVFPTATSPPGPQRLDVDWERLTYLKDIPLPPPSRPVYQSYPFHPSIMDETGLFSKETQRVIDRLVTDIGGRDLSRRFKGVVSPETVTSLDMTNDPVISAEKTPTGFAALSSWVLPVDQPGRGGQPSMPLRDEQTPVRVTVLLRLLPDHCLTKKAHEQNAVATVPTIDNNQICRPLTNLTATDLLCVSVYEVTEPGNPRLPR